MYSVAKFTQLQVRVLSCKFILQSFLVLLNAHIILLSKLSVRKIIKSINSIGLEIVLGIVLELQNPGKKNCFTSTDYQHPSL